MSVDDVGIEAPPRSHGTDKVGSEETDEGKACSPRARDILSHVARVCELLVTARGIAESLDRDSVDLFLCRHAFSGRRYDVDFDAFVAKRNGQSQNERSRRVPGKTRERMS